MLRLLLISIALSVASYSVAQFTANDFPREAEFTDYYLKSSSVFDMPQHGSGLIWDYSSAVTEEAFTNYYFDASGDPFFLNALNYRKRDLNFQGFLIESNEYYALDENTYSAIGRTITDVEYSITGITGGANDKLRFVGGNNLYPGTLNYLRFPLSYEDSWSQEYEQNIDYELTVAAFGLNAVPGKQMRFLSETRKVVGEGSFIIPDENGDPSDPIQGLLIRSVRSATDSIYLAGSLAPEPLMNVFGLTQGMYAADSFYVAYAYGFGSQMLNINITGNNVDNIFYRPDAAALGQPPISVNEHNTFSAIIHPNPVTKGRVLNIQARVEEPITAIQLFDLSGKKVHEVGLSNPDIGSGVAIAVPGTLKPGMYFVGLQNNDKKIIGRTRLIVQ